MQQLSPAEIRGYCGHMVCILLTGQQHALEKKKKKLYCFLVKFWFTIKPWVWDFPFILHYIALDTVLCTLHAVCDLFPLGALFCSFKIPHKLVNHLKHIFQMPHVMLMTTYQTIITQNMILNGCRCHFRWHWAVVPLGALCFYQQVGSTGLPVSQPVHDCID